VGNLPRKTDIRKFDGGHRAESTAPEQCERQERE
jgi:hypothetical protein